MAKKVKTSKTFKQIGEAIKAAWIAGEADKQINRSSLLQAMDLQDSPGNMDQKNVVYDIITDQEIDADTRMVWICVPTPDTKGSWVTYANQFNTDDELADLGKAALFGCGR